MRFIIYGVGAVGGTIAVRLIQAGFDTIGIARGRMLEAIRQNGLTLVTPLGRDTVTLPCHDDPTAIDWRPDDVIFLTMKTQDTTAALDRLHAAGVLHQAVVCAQNSVTNEPLALRHFPNVYGLTVMLPADYTEPGTVAAFGAPKQAIFDIGRYPSGADDTAFAIADALRTAGFPTDVQADVMASKYGKLIMNVANIIGAALGEGKGKDWHARARAEAETVLAAAGIAVADNVSKEAERRELIRITPIDGITRTGSSSTQSIARGTGSIETDWLNGEFVLLGRQHGIPVPVNAALCEVARRMVRDRIPVGEFPEAEIEELVAALT